MLPVRWQAKTHVALKEQNKGLRMAGAAALTQPFLERSPSGGQRHKVREFLEIDHSLTTNTLARLCLKDPRVHALDVLLERALNQIRPLPRELAEVDF